MDFMMRVGLLGAILVTMVISQETEQQSCTIESPYIASMTISDAQAQFDDVRDDLNKLAGKLNLPVDVTNGAGYPIDCRRVTEGSGLYMIRPTEYHTPFRAYCDMETDLGGWTVIQRRVDGSVNFHRGWVDYSKGFGSRFTEYWIGNEHLYWLTAQDQYELMVDLEDFNGEHRVAKYQAFRIGDEATGYQLQVGHYDVSFSNAGDALSQHDRLPFSTPDSDNDFETSGNCATHFRSGWWFADCYQANLNGVYRGDGEEPNMLGVVWAGWRGLNISLKSTEMKIRPFISL